MKAITISQPYASLIASGKKWIENRTWPTNHRGLIAIHAGKGTQYMTRKEMADENLPVGQIIAVATLVQCLPIHVIRRNASSRDKGMTVQGTTYTWEQVANHEHAEGPWCWILDDIVPRVDPLTINGKQRIWTVDAAQAILL